MTYDSYRFDAELVERVISSNVFYKIKEQQNLRPSAA